MFALLATDIHLMPDGTLVLQLVVFLAAMAILSRCLFRPILAIIDRRRSFTVAARSEAERWNGEAERLEAEHRTLLEEALHGEEELRHNELLRCQREADQMIAEARARARDILSAAGQVRELSTEQEGALARNAKELGGAVATALMQHP